MKAIRLLSALLALLMLTGCGRSTASLSGEDGDPSSVTLFAMDTVMELTAYGEHGQEALDQAAACISRLEGLLSTTDEDSEIYAANHSGGGTVPLSEDTAALLGQALALCGDTGGVLDVSIYPVVRAWGFTTG